MLSSRGSRDGKPSANPYATTKCFFIVKKKFFFVFFSGGGGGAAIFDLCRAQLILMCLYLSRYDVCVWPGSVSLVI